MPTFRGQPIYRRGGNGNSSRDDAPPHGIVRPQVPGFYDWALDPDMNPDHILNQAKKDDGFDTSKDSDIPKNIIDRMNKGEDAN